MFLAWWGCAPDETPPGDPDTGAFPAEHVVLERAPIVRVVSDDATTWALAADGGLLVEGDAAWTEAPSFGETVLDADARGGLLWALGLANLGRYDGSSWQLVPLPKHPSFRPLAVVARADGTVTITDEDEWTTWDGASWTPGGTQIWGADPIGCFLDLTETAEGELVAVGCNGWVGRLDEGGWTELRSGGGALSNVAPEHDGVVAVGRGGEVVRGPLDALLAEGVDAFLNAVDVGPTGEVWASAGDGAVWRDAGAGFAPVVTPEGAWFDVLAHPQGAWVVGAEPGGPAILDLGGTFATVAWSAPSFPEPVYGAWLAPDGALWLAGNDVAGRWSDALAAWSLPIPDGAYWATASQIEGSSADDVVAMGSSALWSFNGAGWHLDWASEDEDLADVSIAADGSAFAVGDVHNFPFVLQRTAFGWEPLAAEVPVVDELTAVLTLAAGDVYALTDDAPKTLLHYDGARWSVVTDALPVDAARLWGRSGRELYLGGAELLRWDGQRAAPVAGAPTEISALTGDARHLLAVGGDELWVLADGAWSRLGTGPIEAVAGGGGRAGWIANGEAWRAGW